MQQQQQDPISLSSPWWYVVDVLALLGIVVLALMLTSCSGGRLGSAQLASALNVAAVPVNASYAAAYAVCEETQEALVVQVEKGEHKRAEVQPQIDRIRARCARVMEGYEELRALHEQALALVRSGKIEQAEAAAARLAEEWGAFTAGFTREEVSGAAQ